MRILIIILFFTGQLKAQVLPGMKGLLKPNTTAAMQFISFTATVYTTTTSPKDAVVSVNNGDILVAISSNGDNSEGDISVATNAGSTSAWTQQQAATGSTFPEIWLWTATATATGSITVRFTQAATASRYGGCVYVIRNSIGGLDLSVKNTNAGSAPSLSITTTAANDLVIYYGVDWNASNAARTWRTINGITPTAGNTLETLYSFVSGDVTVYSGYWNDAGTAGAVATGQTTPSQKWTAIAIAIKK